LAEYLFDHHAFLRDATLVAPSSERRKPASMRVDS